MTGALWFLLLLASFIPLAVSYSTSGNRILDPNGNQIVIRGVARPSLEWNPQGQFLSLNDYQLMKNWGANSVRLSLNQCYWLPGSIGYSSGYVGVVDQQVAWIKSLGMGVILDLHWTNQGVSSWGCDKQQPMADAWSTTFWTQLANRYKNDPWIMFELFNEPYITDWNIWRDGGNTYGFNVVGFQSLYNTVRATGANNVVIINGLNYAYDLSGAGSRLITGTNIVYGTHPYNFPEKQPGDWDRAFGYLAANYPLIATEFGTQDCSTSYINSFINYFDSKCISWTAWAWWAESCNFPSIIGDWNGTPYGFGSLLKTSLQSNFKCGATSSTTKSATTKSATTTTATTKSSTTTTTTGGSTTGGGGSNTNVYVDSVVNSFQDWSWASVRNSADGSTKQAGSASYSFQPTNYGAVYFYKPDSISKSAYKSIDFWFNRGNVNNLRLNFNLLEYTGSSSNKIGPDNSVASYCGTLNANTWVKCSVPLSGFPAGWYDGLWFIAQTDQAQGTVYIDSVVLVAI